SALTFIAYATVSNKKNLPTNSLLTAFDLNSTVREAQQGELLLAIPEFESLPAYFTRVAVKENVKGHILKALNHASII
ncbi:peptidoglycan-binding protein, partial [Psychromonas aquatilis]